MDLKGIGWEYVDWILLAQDSDLRWTFANTVTNLPVVFKVAILGIAHRISYLLVLPHSPGFLSLRLLMSHLSIFSVSGLDVSFQ
jgi:hypothetical protein